MVRAILSLFVALLLLIPVSRAAVPAPSYGDEVSGLQLAIEQAPNGTLKLMLLNRGPQKAQLDASFAWILLAQSRDSAYFTPKLSFPGPATLSAGETRELVVSLPEQPLHLYEKGAKVVRGYPEVPQPRTVAAADLPSSLRAQAIAYIQLAGEPVSVKSKTLAIAPRPQLASSASTLPAGTAELLEQFRRDAFAAQAAHERALKLGPAVLPALTAALADRSMPDFSSMWIATAVIQIDGPDAERAAAGLIHDPREGVRHVLAYHGPARNSKAIDAAILQFAGSSSDPLFTAWAARGFAEHGRKFPPALVDAAVASSEPRARAEIAKVLARTGDMKRLARLSTDEHELVRVAAADAVAEYSVKDPMVIQAMVSSLEMPGEAARARVVESASRGLGRDWVYDAQASDEQKVTLFRDIRRAAQRP